jgi:hypothetical protein
MAYTYWKLHPRDFANEFHIGIATTETDAEQYEAEGFKRVDRDYALRELSYRPASHQQCFITVTVDGHDPTMSGILTRQQVARNLRTGRELSFAP